MPSFDRSSTVRSHRRGGTRRRSAVTLWLGIGAVLVLVGGGAVAGYTFLIKDSCSGRAEATIVVTPRIEPIMQQLNQDWAKTTPSANGVCTAVTVRAAESSAVATALGESWDAGAQGPPPDVWVPDSSAWVRKASADADAERLIPDLQPSLARTPTVIAMPRPMAEAAGMSSAPLTWQQIIAKLNAPDGWGAYAHTEWGPFKVGLSDPQASTAGLLALMALSDTDDNGEISEAEQETLLALKRVVSLITGSTAEIFDGLRQSAALTYVSAFPALEQDVLSYNLGIPKVPLFAVYPQDGTAEADFPYLVLNAPWSTPAGQAAAGAFLSYARGAQGKAAFLAAGFRDGNRAPGPALTAANGVAAKITALPRAILLPESVQHAAASWTAVTRPTNVLMIFDTSGSMGEVVPGAGKTRLDLTKAAAQGALELLDDSAQVGVWNFSTLAGGRDHQVVLPLAPLSQKRAAVSTAIDGLRAQGNTGLYNTAWAACQEVAGRYQPGAANIVLLLTDGADDNNVTGGLTLDALLANLGQTCGDPAKPVSLITIGLGTSSDSEILRQISAATHATTFSSPTSFDISQVVLAALFT